MNSKQQTGEFSHKAITMTFSPGPAGTLTVQANFEGSATGFPSVMSTMVASPAGQNAGSFTWDGVAFMDDGSATTAHLQGTFVSTGKQVWRMVGAGHFADGRRARTEGELTLATRTWKGTFTVLD